MPETSIPAVLKAQPDWVCASLNQSLIQDGEAVKRHISLSVNAAVHEVLEIGVATRLISQNGQQMNRFVDEAQTLGEELLGEVVTRADGTEITLAALLSEKFTAVIQPLYTKES